MIVHLLKDKGHITEGRTLDQICAFLPNGEYVATIETKAQWEKKKPRSLNQNALMWLWFEAIAGLFNQQYGDDYWNSERVHDFFCDMFKKIEVTPDGKPYSVPVRTSKFTKKQMTEFMNKIQSYIATEHGASVPLPDDEKYADFNEFYR